MDEATYRALPESLEVREVRVVVDQPGSRVRQFVVEEGSPEDVGRQRITPRCFVQEDHEVEAVEIVQLPLKIVHPATLAER